MIRIFKAIYGVSCAIYGILFLVINIELGIDE